MSLTPIPDMPFEVDTKTWDGFQTQYERLEEAPLEDGQVREWLQAWSRLAEVMEEVGTIAYIEASQDTTDEEKELAFLNFIENIAPAYRVADHALTQRLLGEVADTDALGDDLTLVLRRMRNAADLFRDINVPLMTELAKLGNRYDKITGGMTADWEGESKNLSQLNLLLQEKDRGVRQRAWETMQQLWQAERRPLNDIFRQMLTLREQMAANADLPDFREYAFRDYNRFDYTPQDCFVFHEAIEAAVVPAATRVYEKRRIQLGLDHLRPWDLNVEPSDNPALKPFSTEDELIQGSLNIFQQVDPVLARHFAVMAEDRLLDLETRSGKALGGYCSALPVRQRPFIFMNSVGTHDDLQTMLHEAGHAFHAFESFKLPLFWQANSPMEFCEVASMGMELLSAPYLTADRGGFYTAAEASRARIEHLSGVLTFLPYMAVVDAFQHWVYTHPTEALEAGNCDATWDALWARFMPGVDWTGLEQERMSGWHRKLHIFHVPFYYIEYGLAQVGALQVWRNALVDQEGAVANYRAALALGGTRSLPELFAAAGAEFRFDTAMLRGLVGLIEETIEELEAIA